MKKVIVLLFVLIGINFANVTPSYAGFFSDSSNLDLNEVDSFSNIVIFIRFQDEVDYVAPHDYTYYDNMFNGVDVVSLRDYYLEVSYGKLTIDSYLVNDNSQIIYFTDNHDRSYYEPFHNSENPDGYLPGEQASREHVLLKATIDYIEDNNLIDDSIVLDANSDGDIDSITFMVAGEDSGWNTLLWPHKWSLTSFYNFNTSEYETSAPTINGVYAYDYTFELLGNSVDYEEIVYTGVLAHETFHLISAPDLYHYYESGNIDAVGDWGLMGSSTYIPSHMLGYMKQYYGKWIDTVTEISESGTYTLYPLQESEDNLYRVDLGFSNEFIYIEYRDNQGLYESNLPGSGLIVYRVDFDYFDEGNVYGYYDSSGMGEDEVFVFRPGIPDNEPPITFPVFDNETVDEDGVINSAALSNFNANDEMGIGTDIQMFYSNGELMNVTISNVVKHGGYITFDIDLPSRIELDIDEELSEGTELFLVNNELFEYNFTIENLPSLNNIYYTLDGSMPTTSDTLYEGGLITFSASTNVITIAEYDGETFVSSSSKEFNFVDTIESDHFPYGNYEDVSWYLDFKYEITDYFVTFYNDSELEVDYDFIHIIDDGVSVSYSGIDMRFEKINYNNENLLIHFESDSYIDEYFGFRIDIEMNNYIDIELYGNDYVELNIGDTYTEEGAFLSGANLDLHSIQIDGSVDTNQPGTHIITYSILDIDSEVIESITRTVNVLDISAPVISLIGEEIVTMDYLDFYDELGVNYTDNLNEDLTYEISGIVNTRVLGQYILEYTVTDSYGNVSNVVTRIVNVVDVEFPEISLVPSLDTIFVGDEYIDMLVNVNDNHTYDLEIVVEGIVDINVAGEYLIVYSVTDFSGNTSSIKRYVNVIEKEVTVTFSCEAGISTFGITDDINPPVCYVDGELANVTLIMPNVYNEGTYEIVYSVTIDGILYQKTSYIFIYDDSDKVINYYDFKRRDTL